MKLRRPFDDLVAIGAAPTCLLVSNKHDFRHGHMQAAGHGALKVRYRKIRRDDESIEDALERKKRQPVPGHLPVLDVPEPIVVKGSNHLMVTNVQHVIIGRDEQPQVSPRSTPMVKEICADQELNLDRPGRSQGPLERKKNICAVSQSSSLCPGDSGGPLYWRIKTESNPSLRMSQWVVRTIHANLGLFWLSANSKLFSFFSQFPDRNCGRGRAIQSNKADQFEI